MSSIQDATAWMDLKEWGIIALLTRRLQNVCKKILSYQMEHVSV